MIIFDMYRDKNDLLDLCDRLLDMNPVMRPTTQMVVYDDIVLIRFYYIHF